MKPRPRFLHGRHAPRLQLLLILPLLLCFSWRAAAQAQQPPQTDPVEAAAVNAILNKLGLRAPASWNISGNPCSGAATDDTPLDDNPAFNPAIKCDCSDQNNTLCHVIRLKINMLDAVGPIPEELRNLTHLRKLDFRRNYFTGPLPAFIGELTALEFMTVGINALSGPLPKELGNLINLKSLALGSNNFNGTLPDELGKLAKLQQIYIDSNDFSGPLPSTLSQLTNLSILWASDNNFSGQIPDYLGSLTNLTQLRIQGNSFQGPIPRSLSNLVKLKSLRIGDIVNGSSPLVFIGNMTSLGDLVLRNSKISDMLSSVDFSKFGNLSLLDLSFNNITGQTPQSILNLPSLSFLFLGNNSLSGSLPATKNPLLTNLDFSYNHLSGSFPSWATQKNLQLNLVANDFVADNSNNSVLPWGLNCLQRNTPCFLGSPQSSSFAVDCGGGRTISGSDNSMYQADNASLGAASYYVAGAPTWGVSSVGRFMDPPNGSYIIYSSRQFENTLDSALFQTARMSPSSLRYYGIGLENGNYTVTLQFAEVDFPDIQSWRSRGRRVFDIYVQGERKEQNFDIRKAVGGKSFTVVKKQYVVPVTKNFLEIHLFWAGKGTCCIPTQGYYGPAISALSATPNFIPTVRSPADNKRSSKTGVIVGVVVGVSVFALAALVGIIIWRQKRRKLLLELEELYTIVGRPNVFSYSELRSATDNFRSSNLLGEGGYGSVYKGKLSDGRVVAVKQLSQSSNQGKMQFAAEIETISRVQHRNLVRLYGCCLESNTPLLVYEYLENGGLPILLPTKRKQEHKNCTRTSVSLQHKAHRLGGGGEEDLGGMNTDLGAPRELAGLQQRRALYQPELPPCLQGTRIRVDFGDSTTTIDPKCANIVAQSFPHTFGQKLVHFLEPNTMVSDAQVIKERPPIRVGVLFSGRQSPGGHNVIWGIYDAMKAQNPHNALLGFVGGTEGLFAKATSEITEDVLSSYKNQGGFDLLGRTVDQIRTTEQINAAMSTCCDLNLDGLIIIGGVTSNSDAAQLAETFADHNCKTKVVGVPVTLSGDLKNQFVETTVGFDTVCKVNSQLISNVCLDAVSAGKYYYFVRLMGGKASHVALECALQSHPNMVILGEEVALSKLTLMEITNKICDGVEARAAQGKYHGVLIIPEGLIESIPEVYALTQEINNLYSNNVPESDIPSQLSPWAAALFMFFPPFIRRELLLHQESDNSAQLSQIDTERLLAHLVEAEMNKRTKEGMYKGRKFSSVCHFFGSQARGSLPSNFDCDYAYVLGHVCVHILAAGLNGYMATVTNLKDSTDKWRCAAVPLTAMMSVRRHLRGPGAVPIGKPVIHPSPIDLKGKSYAVLREKATSFLLDDFYRTPGGIQFEGPGADAKPITLTMEDQDYLGEIEILQDYLEKVRTILKPGCTREILKAAISSIASVNDVLKVMSVPLNAERPLYHFN